MTQIFVVLRLTMMLLMSAATWGGTPQIAAGGNSSFAIDSQANLFGWGRNDYGVLGLSSLTSSKVPILAVGGSPFVQVALGHQFAIGLSADGSVWAWGKNNVGQLGDGTTTNRSSPVLVGVGFSAVATGYDHALAIKTDGSLWAWGQNASGQLGSGTTTGWGTANPNPKQIGTNFVTVSASWYRSFAIKNDGSLWAWGANEESTLGDGTTTNRSSPIKIGTDFSVVEAGGYAHSLAIKNDGSLWAWGRNQSGQLGDGTTTSRSTPQQVGTGYKAVSAGTSHTVALKSDGSLWAWGDNSSGQFGIGSNTWYRDGVPKFVGSGYKTVGASFDYTLAVKLDGTLWAWGMNLNGELGSNGVGDVSCGQYLNNGVLVELLCRTTPVQIGSGFAAVKAGTYVPDVLNIATKIDGTLWAWGKNDVGQLGVANNAPGNKTNPTKIGTDYRLVATKTDFNNGHSAAIKSDGSLWTWGDNSSGQLGDGSMTGRSTPKQIGVGYAKVTVGGGFSVALKSDGTLWAWGGNQFGSVGNGKFQGFGEPPILSPVLIGSGFGEVASGRAHSLALKNDTGLWAWGHNYFGQLGDGTTANRSSPIQIGTGYSAVAVGAGRFGAHSVALKSDGSLWTWGSNESGQLGDGTRTNSSNPKQIGTGFSAVAAGDTHTVALKNDGSLWAWGDNRWGQFGDGTTTSSLIPKQTGSGFSAVSAGTGHTLALKSDGTVWAWGDNKYGELGDATLAGHSTPLLTTNEIANGPLDLIPESTNNIPADKIPPYWLQVTKAADVATAITYNNEDLNKEGSVFVVAYLDPASPLLAGSTAMPRAVKAAAGTSTPVPAVLTRSGWKQMSSAAPTEPLYSGPLVPSSNKFSMYDASKFDQTKDNGLFCVAYAGASANSAKGLIRSVVSGVDANLNQCPPLLVGISTTLSECFFNWAERNYPQYFAPAAAASATLTPYYYRYYSGTGNYLATNSADRHVWALGKDTSGNPLDLGLLSNYTGTAGCQ